MSDVNQLTSSHGVCYDRDYRLDGVTLGAPFPLELVEKAGDFPFMPDDVIVASYPRSGEDFLCEIVWLLTNDADTEGATNIPLARRLPLLEMAGMSPEEPPAVERLAGDSPPRVAHTHLPWALLGGALAQRRPKVLLVLRDPREMVPALYCSYSRWPGRELPSFDYFFEKFLKPGRLLFGDHIEHLLGYWTNAKSVDALVFKYHEMRANVEDTVLKVSYFLGNDMTPKQMHSIVKFMKCHQAARQPGVKQNEAPLVHAVLGVRLFEGERFNIEGKDPDDVPGEEEKKDEEKEEKKKQNKKKKDKKKSKKKHKEKDLEEQKVIEEVEEVSDAVDAVDQLSQADSEPTTYPPMEVEIMTVRKPLELSPEQEEYIEEQCRLRLHPAGLVFSDVNS